jgi:hypothetical protein
MNTSTVFAVGSDQRRDRQELRFFAQVSNENPKTNWGKYASFRFKLLLHTLDINTQVHLLHKKPIIFLAIEGPWAPLLYVRV